jgi:hypothetical protein
LSGDWTANGAPLNGALVVLTAQMCVAQVVYHWTIKVRALLVRVSLGGPVVRTSVLSQVPR